MNYKQNHSRNLNYTKDYANRLIEREKTKPTNKQIKFFSKLLHVAKDNNIDLSKVITHPRTRMQFAMAIDELINLLKENNIDIKTNNKNVSYNIIVENNPSINAVQIKERIVIDES